MQRFGRIRQKPRTFQSHLIEDELERIIISIRTKLSVFEQMQNLGDQSTAVQRQIDQIRTEVTNDLQVLQKSGYSITDILGKLDRLVYRKEIIEASRIIKDAEDKGESHRIVDLFNEDAYLNSRLKYYQKSQDKDDQLESILSNNNWTSSLDIMYDNPFDDRSDDDLEIEEDESKEGEQPTSQDFQPSPKMLGNAEVRKIEKAMMEQNLDEAKRIAKVLLKDYINKKELKNSVYDVSPKTKKFGFILQKLFPDISSKRKSSEQYAKEILQAS